MKVLRKYWLPATLPRFSPSRSRERISTGKRPNPVYILPVRVLFRELPFLSQVLRSIVRARNRRRIPEDRCDSLGNGTPRFGKVMTGDYLKRSGKATNAHPGIYQIVIICIVRRLVVCILMKSHFTIVIFKLWILWIRRIYKNPSHLITNGSGAFQKFSLCEPINRQMVRKQAHERLRQAGAGLLSAPDLL